MSSAAASNSDKPAQAATTAHSHNGEPPCDAGKIIVLSRASRRRRTMSMEEIASSMSAKPSWNNETCQTIRMNLFNSQGYGNSAFHPLCQFTAKSDATAAPDPKVGRPINDPCRPKPVVRSASYVPPMPKEMAGWSQYAQDWFGAR